MNTFRTCPTYALAIASMVFMPSMSRASEASLQGVFSTIYESNGWESAESRSGPGSSLEQTMGVRRAVEDIITKLGVGHVLDAACGDFGWMRLVDMRGASYTGMDVVPALIDSLQRTYGTADGSRSFQLGDMTRDELPTADLIIARDVLGHLSYAHGLQALRNFKASGAHWLLTTTFDPHRRNFDIPDGDWRPINLESAPYNLGTPVTTIIEHGLHPDDEHIDKALGLYDLWALEL